MKVYCHKCKKYDWCHNTIYNNDKYNCKQYEEEKILFLVVTKNWYTESAAGRKMVDYRPKTPHWEKRMYDKNDNHRQYDTVILQLGYSKRFPQLRFKFKKIQFEKTPDYVKCTVKTDYCFAIYFEQFKESKR